MKSTTDIWFASFLMSMDHKCVDFNIISRYKGEYKYNISEADWKKLKLLYINSEVKKIEDYQKQLKDLLY